jgi:uncharacterized membrane protein YeaQ/YmgE (transglycosylase-associated protein family)
VSHLVILPLLFATLTNATISQPFLRGGPMTAVDLPSFFKSSYFFIDFQDRFMYWLLVGLVAGWLAGKISRGRGFGCITDIVLGLIGSFLGGFVFAKLGILGNGFLYSLAAATLGAVILVSIAHLFSSGHQ